MDYKVKIDGKVYEYPEGTAYQTIAKEHQKDYPHDIVLVSVDHKLQELSKKLSSDCELSFLTTATFIGQQTYRRRSASERGAFGADQGKNAGDGEAPDAH